MMQAVLITIVATASIFLGTTLLIVGQKAWREIRDAWRRSRRRVLEQKVLEYAHGAGDSVRPFLGGPRAGDRNVIEAILLDHIHRVRGIEKLRLGKALDELGYVDRYLRGIRSARWWARADAAEKLGLAGATRATQQLAAAMNDPVHEVRMRAAKALGAVGGSAAIQPLIGALAEPNRWSSIRLADILTAMGPGITAELVHAWPTLNRLARIAAIEILGRIKSLESVGFLRKRLDEDEPDVRARACHALGAIGDGASGGGLLERLNDDAWPVRAMAAKALGRVGHHAAIPALSGALRDREWWVRANAAESLRQFGAPGLEALERMLDDADVYARHQAVIMLEETGRLDEEVGRLASVTEGEREVSEKFVRRFVQAGQVGRLHELAASHRSESVRRALTVLLPPPPKGAEAKR